LSVVFNDWRQLDDVTSDGRLFQVLATATGNTWLLIAQSRI